MAVVFIFSTRFAIANRHPPLPAKGFMSTVLLPPLFPSDLCVDASLDSN